MSDWASPILVIPKKEEQAANSSDSSTATLLTITNLISDFALITENSIAAS